jgi:hypothetical protein
MLTGTFDTIAITDVLDLLTTTHKTGLLTLSSSGRRAVLEWHEGYLVSLDQDDRDTGTNLLVGAEDDALIEHFIEACFVLGRDTRGTFDFAAWATAETPSASLPVSAALDELRSRLARWSAITDELGSLDAVLELSADLATPAISFTASRWAVLVALVSRAPLEQVARDLNRNVIDVADDAAALVRERALRVVPGAIASERTEAEDPVVTALEQVLAREALGTDEEVADDAGHDDVPPAPAPDPEVVAEIEAALDGVEEPAADHDGEGSGDGDGDESAAPADRGAILRLFSALKDS